MPHYRTYTGSPLYERNHFPGRSRQQSEIPGFEESRSALPAPFWDGREAVIDGYWRAWELAFKNLRSPKPGSRFITPYIDTAFNGNLFMWDSVFCLMYGRYGRRVFDFQGTLDNFYAVQHEDGFICRELNGESGEDAFARLDPASTGPELLAWSEWEYYRTTGDRRRLAAVFPALLAYRRWMSRWRTWPSGGYFSSGWGCGMDNQPRTGEDYHPWWDHGHMTWVDATLQAYFVSSLLQKFGAVLGEDTEREQLENRKLKRLINRRLWNRRLGLYTDLRPDGTLSDLETVAGFWALLTDIPTPRRRNRMLSALLDENRFNTPHPFPALAARSPHYSPEGEYWCGGVWPPTNYMILKGLRYCDRPDLARDFAARMLAQVTQTAEVTGTYWENYAPVGTAPGNQSVAGCVGWGGVTPIAVLLEELFGLSGDGRESVLEWDISLTEGFGVRNYPFGNAGSVDLEHRPRSLQTEQPRLRIQSDTDLTLRLRYGGRGFHDYSIPAGKEWTL